MFLELVRGLGWLWADSHICEKSVEIFGGRKWLTQIKRINGLESGPALCVSKVFGAHGIPLKILKSQNFDNFLRHEMTKIKCHFGISDSKSGGTNRTSCNLSAGWKVGIDEMSSRRFV